MRDQRGRSGPYLKIPTRQQGVNGDTYDLTVGFGILRDGGCRAGEVERWSRKFYEDSFREVEYTNLWVIRTKPGRRECCLGALPSPRDPPEPASQIKGIYIAGSNQYLIAKALLNEHDTIDQPFTQALRQGYNLVGSNCTNQGLALTTQYFFPVAQSVELLSRYTPRGSCNDDHTVII